jgi:hypothetical protein
MSDWLHNLSLVWMALLVFSLIFLVTAAIYVVVAMLSVGERARSFKAVSPGLLPPLGVLFALFMAFTASQVWSDNDKANSVVDREASALRTVVILATAFPGEPEWTKNRMPDRWRDVQRHEVNAIGLKSAEELRQFLALEFKDLIDQGVLKLPAPDKKMKEINPKSNGHGDDT